MKKLLFAAVANVAGLLLLAGAAEFAVRWRVEGGARAAWRSVIDSRAPFSDLGTRNTLIADPELGYRYNPALPEINSFGIRHAEIPPAKQPGIARLIVLGDSVSAQPDGYVGILGERLRGRAEVINAAIPGYTTYQQRRLLERDLLATSPDLVLLQYSLNDHHRFLHRFDAAQRLLITEDARHALLPPGDGPLWRLARHSYLVFRLRMAALQFRHRPGELPWENQPDVAPAWQDDSWGVFEQHLAAMNNRLRDGNARLAVIMSPYRPQLEDNVRARGLHVVLKPQRRMAEVCSRLGIPLLDLYPVLQQSDWRPLFSDDYHFTAAGHRLVAEAVDRFGREGQIWPPGL